MVLSEPFGRIEARTTYGKVPPRKRPALGRRYRPEQDFSSGLRRRDDRRTGTPDPCSAALYGKVRATERYATRSNGQKVEVSGVNHAVHLARSKEVADLIEEAASHPHATTPVR